MKTITTPIIPQRQTFAKVDAPHELHLEAICVFTAIGFFLDQDTYWKDQVVLSPASTNTIDDSGLLRDSKPWFQWHHSPGQMTFEEALEAFTQGFESIIKEHTQGKKVILPLSGGLDSRTQATALKKLGTEVISYSYEFENGYPETQIAQKIAKACDFEFKSFTIPKGYLWSQFDTLAKLNQCYSDFTSPRQMAIASEFSSMGDVFSLGHWGDVLFDDMKVEDHLPFEQQVEVLIKKLLKQGGLQLAQQLWEHWALEGEFYDYFYGRVKALLSKIEITNSANARIRTFKSLYWAPRWTSINLSVFENYHPIHLPYYDDRMCQLICSIPERFLKNRQLQIAYIKKRSPDLARITWQDQRPFNLNNYHLNKVPFNVPYKVVQKLKRELKVLAGKPYVQRNWELQFLGEENKQRLKQELLNHQLDTWVPKGLINQYFEALYNEDPLNHAQPINMLLVLSKFNQLNDSTLRPFGSTSIPRQARDRQGSV